MGGSKGSRVINTEPAITPAVAKDAQIAQSMRTAQQQQERSLRRGIASTYSRFGQMQGASENGNGLKKSLG